MIRFYAKASPDYQRLLRYAGMDPEHALLRWGNYNWTFLLSSVVFEPDDLRSYRFRPRTHSVWLKNMPAGDGGPLFFLVPDGPGLADAIRGTPAIPLKSSRQTTNSWGLRGPEPDPRGPVPRDRPGRFLHAGDVHRRRRDAAGVLAALPGGPPEDQGLHPEYRRHGLLAGAILLLPDRVRRPLPARNSWS